MKNKVEAESRQHARLSASSSERWINCTASVAAIEKLPQGDNSTDYSREGSCAHELADIETKHRLGELSNAERDKAIQKLLASDLGKFYNEEMVDYVEDYLSFVFEIRDSEPGSVMLAERKVDLTKYTGNESELGFGTIDNTIISDGMLYITDLKYGKGVRVDAKENSQLMLYALGVVDEMDFLYDIEIVTLTIVQPRLNHVSSYVLSVAELKRWANEEAIPAAQTALSGVGTTFKAGAWCKFCPLGSICKERASYNLKLAGEEFKNPDIMTKEEIAEVLKVSAGIKAWLSSVEEYALTEALAGKNIPGFKVVEGRSVRKILDEEALIQVLEDAAIDQEVIFERSLLPITKLEKYIGKKRFAELTEGLIAKSEGKPTLAPIDDKRSAYDKNDSAKKDFEF